MDKPIEILQKYWGFSAFRKPQEAIISSVLSAKNTIALLPTGGGKSICFQVPALVQQGVCVVVSPLIALIQDQIQSLQKKGIKATTIPSGSTFDDIIRLFDNIKYGKYKFLYLSPERLNSKLIQDKVKELEVNLIAIDEAHCISEWGHDFRPSYRNISILRQLFPEQPIIALTASATTDVLKDIQKVLDIQNANVFQQSFARSNLAYQVHYTEDKLHKLKLILSKKTGSAIVYVNSRNKTKQISNYLNTHNFKSSFFHGGLSLLEKETSFNQWKHNEVTVMVATNAFGMGIDKPDVRVVIHLHIPNSLENYMQEAGRAGRDQLKAFAVLLTNQNDILKSKELLEHSFPQLSEIKEIHRKLYQYYAIAKGELIEECLDFNLPNFCKKYDFVPAKVHHTLQLLHNNAVLELGQQITTKSTIMLTHNSKTILNYAKRNQFTQSIIQALLRAYSGLFDNMTKIDEFYLAKKLNVTSWSIINELMKLSDENLAIYKPTTNDIQIQFLQYREDDITINRITKNIKTLYKQKQEKLTSMLDFVTNNKVCRTKQLLAYFGEKFNDHCGICEVCIDKKHSPKDISNKIIVILKKHQAINSKEIYRQLTANEKDVLITLRRLLSEEIIGLNDYNEFYLK